MAQDDTKLTEFWKKAWDTEEPPFTSPERHKWLAEGSNLDHLLRGRQNQKIFFPLCGNVVDMKWMGDLGHKIVGVDLGMKGLEGFMKKFDIPYTQGASAQCDGTLLKSTDDKYRLYCCDFFKFGNNLESGFDAIFDSAGLVAIHNDLRQQYADVITSLMTPDTVHIVEGVHFPERPWEGPPFGLVESELRAIYEPKCNVEVVERYLYKMAGDSDDDAIWEEMDCTYFKITLKQ